MVQKGAWQDAYRQKLNGPGVPAPATQRFMQDARERPPLVYKANGLALERTKHHHNTGKWH